MRDEVNSKEKFSVEQKVLKIEQIEKYENHLPAILNIAANKSFLIYNNNYNYNNRGLSPTQCKDEDNVTSQATYYYNTIFNNNNDVNESDYMINNNDNNNKESDLCKVIDSVRLKFELIYDRLCTCPPLI